ncbi:kinase-like domain-containing protein [Crepidotus variabilis]|uniref:Kinase-like domain-containing protein n=1 Tax=Crepidotus variabilis TaxID=179855 RepID=A0A9P6EHD4_9AGAR|nr:kinase-like domain-containing protein [Crepidotus variabilis]
MPSPMPQMQHHMQPGMPMGWSPYYYPAADEQQQYMYGWYGHIPPGPVLPSTPVPTPVPNPETPSISHVEAGSTIHADAMPSPRLQHIDTHRAPDSHPLPPHDQPISAPRPPHDRPIPAPRSPHDRLTPMPRPPIRLNFPRATPLDIYLQLVKQKLTPSNFRLKRWKQYQSRIAETNEDTTFIVLQIAQRLRTHPRLLHGANCLIQPRYRIHCSTTATEVKHFVLIDPPDPMAFCKIYSFENESFAVNLRSHDIKQLLVKDVEWERQIESSPDEEWLACVAEILREIIDDARTEDSSRSMARTRLHRLGKAGILPPSIFIHFVDSNIPQYESMIEHSISGGFCDAHRITIDGVAVCFRVLRQWENLDSNKEVYRPFSRELSIWHQLKHPNILPLIGATMEIFPKRYCFLVPWLSNGPITHFIKTHPEHDKYLAISQIADGLDYLHNLDPPVGHKDIKGDNILVNADLVCVITDFGLSSILEEQRSMTRGRGTQYWSAPELGTGPLDQDSRPRDVFSFGCTVSEILATEWNSEEQQLWQVAECCLQVLPEDRPLIVEIKRQITTIRSIVTSVPLEQDHGSETSSLSEGSAQTLLGRLYIYVRNFFHM